MPEFLNLSISDVILVYPISSINLRGCKGLYSQFLQLVIDGGKTTLPFIIISNPTFIHKNTLEQLKVFKKPVFIEKPLFHKLNINSIVNYYESNNIFSYVGCNLRFLDSLIYVKDKILVSDKEINEVNVYCGSYLPDWREGNFRENYSSKSELGGGIHLDSIHEIDYIYWMFGSPIEIHRVLKSKSSLSVN